MWEIIFKINLVSFLQVYIYFVELNWDVGRLEELIIIRLIRNLSLL